MTIQTKVLKCDGEVAPNLLCETGGHLADLWTAHPIHRGNSTYIERAVQ